VRFDARSVVATRKAALFDQVRGCGLARHAFGWTRAVGYYFEGFMADLTRNEIPMVAVYRRTRWAENRLATMIIGLPAALLIGFLLPFVAPMGTAPGSRWK
jgi:hypothetical protein